GGGGGGGSNPPACPPGYISNTPATDTWIDTGAANVNDVAAGLDGSVWYITGTPGSTGTTVRISGGSGAEVFNHGGKRIAVDAQGNPWIVDFSGNIWHLVNGSFQELPTGLARDIAVAANGTVWVIGTNTQNGSFEVWSWNGSTWTPNAGSGEEIDVAANGDPVVNGSDSKVWIMNGGANSGWSQVGVNAFDMGLSPCSPAGQASVGGSAMWFVNTSTGLGLLFSLAGSLQGSYDTFSSAPSVEANTSRGQLEVSHVAVDTSGRVWAVGDPGSCDCAGELLERSFA
ncbi:MAG: hypothetical protein JO242_24585, partial [Streptosporangiaceae bacterium]|nr:hypothetical protein [Streptosporangiaceae bacterium]